MKNILKEVEFSKEINLIFLSVLLFATAMGMNLVTIPAAFYKNGFANHNVSIYFSFDMLGGIVMSFFLSKIVARFNVFNSIKFASLCYAAIVSLVYFCQNIYIWFFISFTFGNLWFIYVITRQSWFNILLSNEKRGIATAIFVTTLAFGIFLGPILVKFIGANNYFSFFTSAILIASSFFCLNPLKNLEKPILNSKRIKLIEFLASNPKIFLSRFFLDFQNFLLLTFTVTFGIAIGLTPENAGILISAYMISCIFDIFIGFSFKKFDAQKIINFGFVGCLICFLTIALFYKFYPLLMVIYFGIGLFTGCIFISNLKALNDSYAKEQMVAANSTYQLVGSIGSIVGCLMAAFLVNIIGVFGFLITIILSAAFYLSFIVIYDKKHKN